MARPKYPDPDTVVCIIRDRNDMSILKDQLWYRIPVNTAPECLKSVRFLAFYQTSTFQSQKWSIQNYGPIKKIKTVKRKILFPFEPPNEKSNKLYFRVELTNLLQFRKSIPSRKGRRLIFIPTTFEKLTTAREINDLFHTSPLEDKLWNVFKMQNIDAERQFVVCEKKTFYFLDFAVFCNQRNLDVECDSRLWHGSEGCTH